MNGRKPNLFIVGASKAGTSTLHSYLAEHPQILMSKFKEPAFFLGPTDPKRDRLAVSDRYRNDSATYFQLFDKAKSCIYAGESTTGYTWIPRFEGVAERICHFNPQARVIYLMRDPVERTISHYWWNVRHEGESRAPLDAIRKDRLYNDVSNYAMQLLPYIEQFGCDQVKPVLFEDLTADPIKTLDEITEWLGIDPLVPTSAKARHENVTPCEVTQSRNRPRLHRLRESHLWNAVGPRVPAVVRRIGRSMVERRVDRKNVSMDGVVGFLRPIQRDQTEELRGLIELSFHKWDSLYGSE